jgi:hypothetical protein
VPEAGVAPASDAARTSMVENKAIVRIRNARVSRLLDIVISFSVTTPL